MEKVGRMVSSEYRSIVRALYVSKQWLASNTISFQET